jgi:hypothetical protein
LSPLLLDTAAIDQRKTVAAFRDGYVQAAGQWPKLELASFAVAVSGWLNWM